MANDFECTKCGYREGAHDAVGWDPESYPGICGSYQPSREELAYDRRVARAKAKKALDTPINHSVWMLTPFGPIDIGG